MNIKNIYNNIKIYISNHKKLITIYSLIFMFLFSIYNRIIGALNESLWHESISIYYFILVIIKLIIIVYLNKSKLRKHDVFILRLTKVLLIILNILLIVPIVLMIYNKRLIEMSLIFSITIALYVTIKTTKSIIIFIKKRKEDDMLVKELRIIDLIDTVVSILTLQHTLIFVNSTSFNIGIFYLTIISSSLGLLLNIFLVFKIK